MGKGGNGSRREKTLRTRVTMNDGRVFIVYGPGGEIDRKLGKLFEKHGGVREYKAETLKEAVVVLQDGREVTG